MNEDIQYIVGQFALALGISETDLLGTGKYFPLLDARHLLWFRLKEMDFSNREMEIALKRSHSCFIYARKRVLGLLKIGDNKISQMNEQTKHIQRKYMSTKQHSIVVGPPAYRSKTEAYEFDGFLCPVCNGRKKFFTQTGHDAYDEKPCSYCQSAGRVKAKVTINWEPDTRL
ncbi:MAG: hypothetical protein LBQ73_11065 [Tannerellaceae bacterium]|jgi:hypothetical protein|nr:hypothetical protein [Tannerellaceae bacterium]